MPLTIVEAAYIAGIVDGEGSITLVRSFAARTRGRYVYPVVRVANTHLALIVWLRERVGNGARQYVSAVAGRKDVAHIGWASGQAISLLRQIRPYLIVKAEQADIVLTLADLNNRAALEAGGKFGRTRPIPDWLAATRSAAFVQMATLNRRGVTVIERGDDATQSKGQQGHAGHAEDVWLEGEGRTGLLRVEKFRADQGRRAEAAEEQPLSLTGSCFRR